MSSHMFHRVFWVLTWSQFQDVHIQVSNATGGYTLAEVFSSGVHELVPVRVCAAYLNRLHNACHTVLRANQSDGKGSHAKHRISQLSNGICDAQRVWARTGSIQRQHILPVSGYDHVGIKFEHFCHATGYSSGFTMSRLLLAWYGVIMVFRLIMLPTGADWYHNC